MGTDVDVDSLAKQARRCFRQGKFDEARSPFFSQAVEADEENAELHLGLATVCFLAKRYDEAITHFQRVSQLEPTNGKALINLGAVYNRVGEYKKAVDVLRKGMQKLRDSAEGFYNLGFAQRNLDQNSMAVQAYRQAIRIDPEMAEAHFNLANVLCDMKNLQQAIKHYKLALEINPKFERAQRKLDAAENAKNEAKQSISPFGRLVDEKALRAKAKPGAGRELSEMEQSEDQRKVHLISGEISVAAAEFLEHLQEELFPSLNALNRAVAQGDETPAAVSRAFDNYEAALKRMVELRKGYKRKVLELRAHEELITAPRIKSILEPSIEPMELWKTRCFLNGY